MESKNSEFVFVDFNLSKRNSIASVVPMGISIRRRTHIFDKLALSTNSSSLRVPERAISIAGKVRLSPSFLSKISSEFPVPLNS